MLDEFTAERLRRRHGYRFRARPSRAPLLRVAEQAGIRLRSLGRTEGGSGTLIGDCFSCGREDTFYVEPDRSSFVCVACDLRGDEFTLLIAAASIGAGR